MLHDVDMDRMIVRAAEHDEAYTHGTAFAESDVRELVAEIRRLRMCVEIYRQEELGRLSDNARSFLGIAK